MQNRIEEKYEQKASIKNMVYQIFYCCYRTGDAIWMEIPVPAERGSYGKHISLVKVNP